MTEGRILVVDDAGHVLTALEMLLSPRFRSVHCLAHPKQMTSHLRVKPCDVVLLDMNFTRGQRNGNEGLFWLQQIREQDPDLSVVMMTAFGEVDLAVNALKLGAVDFVLKPWDNQKLLATLQNGIQLTLSRRRVKDLEREKAGLQEALSGKAPTMTGRSAALEAVRHTAGKVAGTMANVLITGENGTGKDLLAREIHQQSHRASQIFVTVDLGCVPETLFESELFGHTKGAFTDAQTESLGKVRAAHRGTLFFDEIGNLSLPMQAKLLHLLQNRTLTPVGAVHPVEVDVRFLFATNMNLDVLVGEGAFRMDLLYRINTIHIAMPPLRQRGKDILLLAHRFLHDFSERYKKPGLRLSEGAEQALESYAWPGNVRELQHAMERAVILTEDKILGASLFQFGGASESASPAMDGRLEDMERAMIRLAMERRGGNLSAVALQLGISRQTLYNKIKKHGLG
ncbi:MAG: sigma-54 dependent transcriptional regulator [Bacteroidales bacterium]